MLNFRGCISSIPPNSVLNLYPTTKVSTITSSCSSSESSSLTTGLALVRPVRLLRPFPRSPPLSFLPRRIFTFTERAGNNQTHKPTHDYGMFGVSKTKTNLKYETALMTMRGETSSRWETSSCLGYSTWHYHGLDDWEPSSTLWLSSFPLCHSPHTDMHILSDSDPSSSSSSSSSLSSPSLSSSFSIFCLKLVNTDWSTMESSYICSNQRNRVEDKLFIVNSVYTRATLTEELIVLTHIIFS